jgi:hypothetical protein
MVVCSLLCFCIYVSVFNIKLFPVCKRAGFLIRCTRKMFVSFPAVKASTWWKKLTTNIHLNRSSRPYEASLPTLHTEIASVVQGFVMGIVARKQVFLGVLRITWYTHCTSASHFIFTPMRCSASRTEYTRTFSIMLHAWRNWEQIAVGEGLLLCGPEPVVFSFAVWRHEGERVSNYKTWSFTSRNIRDWGRYLDPRRE